MTSKLNKKVIAAIIDSLSGSNQTRRKGNGARDRFTVYPDGGPPVEMLHRHKYSVARVASQDLLYFTEGDYTKRVIPFLSTDEDPPHDILEEVHHDAVEFMVETGVFAYSNVSFFLRHQKYYISRDCFEKKYLGTAISPAFLSLKQTAQDRLLTAWNIEKLDDHDEQLKQFNKHLKQLNKTKKDLQQQINAHQKQNVETQQNLQHQIDANHENLQQQITALQHQMEEARMLREDPEDDYAATTIHDPEDDYAATTVHDTNDDDDDDDANMDKDFDSSENMVEQKGDSKDDSAPIDMKDDSAPVEQKDDSAARANDTATRESSFSVLQSQVSTSGGVSDVHAALSLSVHQVTIKGKMYPMLVEDHAVLSLTFCDPGSPPSFQTTCFAAVKTAVTEGNKTIVVTDDCIQLVKTTSDIKGWEDASIGYHWKAITSQEKVVIPKWKVVLDQETKRQFFNMADDCSRLFSQTPPSFCSVSFAGKSFLLQQSFDGASFALCKQLPDSIEPTTQLEEGKQYVLSMSHHKVRKNDQDYPMVLASQKKPITNRAVLKVTTLRDATPYVETTFLEPVVADIYGITGAKQLQVEAFGTIRLRVTANSISEMDQIDPCTGVQPTVMIPKFAKVAMGDSFEYHDLPRVFPKPPSTTSSTTYRLSMNGHPGMFALLEYAGSELVRFEFQPLSQLAPHQLDDCSSFNDSSVLVLSARPLKIFLDGNEYYIRGKKHDGTEYFGIRMIILDSPSTSMPREVFGTVAGKVEETMNFYELAEPNHFETQIAEFAVFFATHKPTTYYGEHPMFEPGWMDGKGWFANDQQEKQVINLAARLGLFRDSHPSN